MHIEHYEKNLRYTDEELLLLARKLGKMATYCRRLKDESSVIRVEAVRRPTKKQRDEVEVVIVVQLPGKTLTADSRKATVIEAVDRCVEKLEPQLLKFKEMHTGKGRVRSSRRSLES